MTAMVKQHRNNYINQLPSLAGGAAMAYSLHAYSLRANNVDLGWNRAVDTESLVFDRSQSTQVMIHELVQAIDGSLQFVIVDTETMLVLNGASEEFNNSIRRLTTTGTVSVE